MKTDSPPYQFCTISTSDYMPYVLALRDSLSDFHDDFHLHVLLSDQNFDYRQYDLSHISIIDSETLCHEGIGKQIHDKYHAENMDHFRWSMKSVLLKYLLEDEKLDRVIYIDNDIHFFSDYAFLFEKLESSRVLLTPHWRPSRPQPDEQMFFESYTQGLYNGGFIGVNRDACEIMQWWAELCLFVCKKDAKLGQFVDQTHLNLFPIYYNKVEVLRHKGCNVANWNQIECRRIEKNGEVLIEGEYPIVFIHFTATAFRGIYFESDGLLKPYADQFLSRLAKYGKQIDPLYYHPEAIVARRRGKKSMLQKIRQSIRLRTRLHRFING